MKSRFLLIFNILFSIFYYAQNQQDSIVRKKITAVRIDKSPKIDGILNEEVWQNAPVAKDFTERNPENGKPEPKDFKTFAKILYDDTGIYFGIEMLDPHPENIKKQLTERDNFGNSDAVGITINGYNDRQQAMMFIVQASGVQLDGKVIANSEDDYGWNAVWYSDVKITEKGWTAEIKIPFSELRFPKKEIQMWGINILRDVQKTNQSLSWNFIDNKKGSYLLYDGVLEGIENINTPTRLSFLPYFSSYVNYYDGKSITNINGGMDVKYGINDAFTLDTTLIPDFGQTNFDATILNLGPFEQQYQEQRSFFTEGTELFSKGNLFYSRRIGGNPTKYPEISDNEELIENPNNIKLFNATKISGRTNKGLGIGIFNGITEKTQATIRNNVTGEMRKEVTEPWANYNVFVLDQRFRGNSSVSMVNTNVMRSGDFRDANTTGLYLNISNKKNTYNFYGSTEGSWVFDQQNKFGTEANTGFSKISGKNRFGSSVSLRTEDYDIDDLGYTGGNNYINFSGFYSYRYLQPKGNLNNLFLNINLWHSRRLETDLFSELGINSNMQLTTKKFLNYGFGIMIKPFGENDIYEPRTFGKYLKNPATYNTWFWWNTDSRKKLQFFGLLDYYILNEKARHYTIMEFSARYRFSDRFSTNWQINGNISENEIGFADKNSDYIYIGKRDRNTISNTLNAQYTFNSKMTLSLSFRHYFSEVTYKNFYILNNDGTLSNSNTYSNNKNGTYNSWNVDLRYSWWFAPGSQISLLYRNQAENYTEVSGYSLKENFKNLFNDPMIHNFSVRITYFLDYNRAKNWFKKKS